METKNHKGWKRFWIYWVPGIIGVLLLLLLLSPFLISTPWGTALALRALNLKIPGTLLVDNLSLSWTGKQEVKRLVLYDPEGNRVLEAKTLSTETPLLTLFYKEIHNIHIENLLLDLHKGKERSNLEESLDVYFIPFSMQNNFFVLREFSGSFFFTQGGIQLQCKGQSLFNGLEGSIDLSGKLILLQN
jgi:hypothetical protein